MLLSAFNKDISFKTVMDYLNIITCKAEECSRPIEDFLLLTDISDWQVNYTLVSVFYEAGQKYLLIEETRGSKRGLLRFDIETQVLEKYIPVEFDSITVNSACSLVVCLLNNKSYLYFRGKRFVAKADSFVLYTFVESLFCVRASLRTHDVFFIWNNYENKLEKVSTYVDFIACLNRHLIFLSSKDVMNRFEFGRISLFADNMKMFF